jgi:hypothetical protein
MVLGQEGVTLTKRGRVGHIGAEVIDPTLKHACMRNDELAGQEAARS